MTNKLKAAFNKIIKSFQAVGRIKCEVQQNHPWLPHVFKMYMIYNLCVSETAIYSLKEKQTNTTLKKF